jgi:hypothetical protein
MPTQISDMRVDLVPIDSVSEHPDNARRGDVETVRASLRAHGQYVPIVVQRSTGHIVKGNHTHRAAKEEGFTEIAVLFRDYSDDQARRVMLMDNASSDKGTYDTSDLVALLAALEGDFAGTGYDDQDLAALLASLEPVAPEPYDRPSTGSVLGMQDVSLGEPVHVTHRGDVWQMGPVTHTLLDGAGEITSGPHHLVVAQVATGWVSYGKFLDEGSLLLPYPGPYLAVTKLGLTHRCVFVQPDGYMAGHLLDKWASIFGADSVVKVHA